MRLLIVGLFIALTGCSTLPTATTPPPAAYLQSCEPLEPLKGMSGEALLKNIIDNAAIHHTCADKVDLLIKAIKVNKK